MKMAVMDGFQTLKEMQKLEKMPVVFAISNLSLDDDMLKVKNMGAAKYFIKSDTPLSGLVEEVKKL